MYACSPRSGLRNYDTVTILFFGSSNLTPSFYLAPFSTSPLNTLISYTLALGEIIGGSYVGFLIIWKSPAGQEAIKYT
jgi:hypothetical protein